MNCIYTMVDMLSELGVALKHQKSNHNITSKAKPEIWDAMRSPFRAKHG